jgi:queuine tRNA-ribosyltransferase
MCLDYCTHPDDDYETQKRSVDITIRWAKRCKDEYNKIVLSNKKYADKKPLLFGIIQGGGDEALRKECAAALIEMGFSGYGFGGWPLDGSGRLMEDILAYTAELMPDDMVKYAMGVGKPENIVACARMGYNLFDCVIPTREARNNRLYVFDGETPFSYVYYYILDEAHIRDGAPVSTECDCLACRKYSRAYLHHLYKLGDSLGYRLATLHNLRFYTRLMEKIRERG